MKHIITALLFAGTLVASSCSTEGDPTPNNEGPANKRYVPVDTSQPRMNGFDGRLPGYEGRRGGDSLGRSGNFIGKLPVDRKGGDSIGRSGNFIGKLPVDRRGGDSI